MINVILFLVVFIAVAVLTKFTHAYLIKKAVIDIPNERSSHTQPTPRGGGLALTSVMLMGLAFLIYLTASPNHLWLLGAMALLFGVSWYDDRKGLSVLVRLPIHMMAVSMGMVSLPDQSLTLGGLLPIWVAGPLILLGWTWFINLYNFMDGIDGITSVESLSITFGIIVLILICQIPLPLTQMIAVVVAGAALGFLVHNWHPAKLFLGDSGSVPLGFIIGFLLLSLASFPFFVIPAIILPLYYLADSAITLAKRAYRREKIWTPHKQHFYQQAVRIQKRHDPVCIRIALTNVVLIGLASTALVLPWLSLMAALCAVFLLLYKFYQMGLKGFDE